MARKFKPVYIQGEYMVKRKDVLTTGQVAQICNVAPRTVTKWFDSGQLRGYRIPGSRDRRIPFSELIRFMKVHNIPTDGIEKGHVRILLIDSNEENCKSLTEMLTAKGAFDICSAHTSFDAGLFAQKFLPNLILINLMACHIDAHQLCTHIRENKDLKDTKVIAIAAGLGENEVQLLQKKGFDAAITEPQNPEQILRSIQLACSIL
jgi:excisionase family DNA binding protein